MAETIKSYKGFNPDMTCKGFQYEEGKEYECDNAEVCKSGFHACEYPLDCFSYYDPAWSVFHEVEQNGELSQNGDDSKIASTKIKIGARLSIAGMVKAAIDFTMSRVKKEAKSSKGCGASSATGDKGASSATGDKGASSATGTYGASLATGDRGASSATGDRGASSATGYKGASLATGDCGASSATGDKGASLATGTYGASSATGYKGASSATGTYGASSATGTYGASLATGTYGASLATGTCGASLATGYEGTSSAGNKESIAVAWGYKGKAKGVLGSYLVFADWEGNAAEFWKPDSWTLKGAKMIQVDGENYKPDTWYTMEKGEIVEA